MKNDRGLGDKGSVTVSRIADIRHAYRKQIDSSMTDAEWNEILTLAQTAIRAKLIPNAGYVPAEASLSLPSATKDTPTPRTDKELIYTGERGVYIVVPAFFARQLERELAEERKKVEALEESRENWMRRAERASALSSTRDTPNAATDAALQRVAPSVAMDMPRPVAAPVAPARKPTGVLGPHHVEDMQQLIATSNIPDVKGDNVKSASASELGINQLLDQNGELERDKRKYARACIDKDNEIAELLAKLSALSAKPATCVYREDAMRAIHEAFANIRRQDADGIQIHAETVDRVWNAICKHTDNIALVDAAPLARKPTGVLGPHHVEDMQQLIATSNIPDVKGDNVKSASASEPATVEPEGAVGILVRDLRAEAGYLGQHHETAKAATYMVQAADALCALSATALASAAPTKEQARRQWHYEIGCKTWENCPTDKECKAFDAGFDAALSATALASEPAIGEVLSHTAIGTALVRWFDKGLRPIGLKLYAHPSGFASRL